MKCPNCGSTAQLKCVWVDEDKYTNTHYKEYKCGCGCHFVAVFEVKEKIIKKT